MIGNLGATTLRRRRRSGNAMRAFDELPAPLRRWMAGAALPWSPLSCRRIWNRARARGETIAATLDRLDRAEAQSLARDAFTNPAEAPGRTTQRQDRNP